MMRADGFLERRWILDVAVRVFTGNKEKEKEMGSLGFLGLLCLLEKERKKRGWKSYCCCWFVEKKKREET